MKIGIDIRLIGRNQTGSEAYFFNLVKSLARIDRDNEYFLFTDRNQEEDIDLKNEIEKLGLGNNFEIVTLQAKNRFCWNFRVLPKYLRKNPVDVFHTQYIAPFWLAKNIKLVLTIHDISFNFFPQFIKFSDLFFLKNLIPRSIRRADKIITVSNSERKNIIDYYKIPPEKIDFTHNGVDLEKFSQNFSEVQKESVRKKYGLPEKFLLYIGTFQPRKNIPVIVEAMKNLDEKLILAGNKNAHNFDEGIEEEIEKYDLSNKIIFPGWIDEEDKPPLLQMASCFVFPSLYEGFGIPGIEAMAAGVPVIATDIPVFREVFGDAALFSKPWASEEYVENLVKIIMSPGLQASLIEKGRETAQKFTWQKTAEKTLAIYQSLG